MKSTDKVTSFTELINRDTPVLVDFYTDWCGPCKMMEPILKELKNVMKDRVTIIKIDAEKNPDVAIKYQVRGVPTLILFQNGQIRWQQAGVMQVKQLQSIISEYTTPYEQR